MQTPRGLMMRALLGEAADEARVGIVVYDENGCCLAANKAMCTVLGYELEELLAAAPQLPEVMGSGTAELRRNDGSAVSGEYIAARTTIAHIEYTVAFFEPRR
jgi:PAS domain S-box-containing protein